MMPQACHIPLGVCGFLLCAIGCGLVPLVMFVRDGMIRELLITDTYDEWSDKHTGIDHPYTVHIWNVTNLLAVVEGGAKPAFEEHTFELTYYEEGYDLQWVDDRKSYDYSSWWNYFPKDDAEAARLNESEIVQINPVYLGSIMDFGGSEANLFTGLGYIVVENVVALLDGFVTGVRYYGVPGYLAAVRDRAGKG